MTAPLLLACARRCSRPSRPRAVRAASARARSCAMPACKSWRSSTPPCRARVAPRRSATYSAPSARPVWRRVLVCPGSTFPAAAWPPWSSNRMPPPSCAPTRMPASFASQRGSRRPCWMPPSMQKPPHPSATTGFLPMPMPWSLFPPRPRPTAAAALTIWSASRASSLAPPVCPWSMPCSNTVALTSAKRAAPADSALPAMPTRWLKTWPARVCCCSTT